MYCIKMQLIKTEIILQNSGAAPTSKTALLCKAKCRGRKLKSHMSRGNKTMKLQIPRHGLLIILVQLLLTTADSAFAQNNGSWQWATRPFIQNSTGNSLTRPLLITDRINTNEFYIVEILNPGGSDPLTHNSLCKYTDTGTQIWCKNYIDIRSAASNNLGDLYVVTSDSLFKLNESGNELWRIPIGFNQHHSLGIKSICTDNAGNVFLAGEFTNSIIVGSTTLSTLGSLGNIYDRDNFYCKVNPNGNILWAKSLSGNAIGLDYITNITCDSDGAIYLTGNNFLTKCNNDGIVEFNKSFGGIGNSIAIGPDGSILLCGYFPGSNPNGSTLTCDNISLFNDDGGADMFLIKFAPNGSILWAKNAGELAIASGVAVNTNNEVFVTGYYSDWYFYSGANTLDHVHMAYPFYNHNFFMLKYSSTGVPIIAIGAGTTDIFTEADGYTVKTLVNNKIIVAGTFEDDIILGPTTLYANESSSARIFLGAVSSSLNAIEANEERRDVLIYPNPNAGEFQLKLTGRNNADFTIQIYTVDGRLILEKKFSGNGINKLDFDLNYLSTGSYLLKYSDENSSIFKKLNISK
jgi:hypothetical protein